VAAAAAAVAEENEEAERIDVEYIRQCEARLLAPRAVLALGLAGGGEDAEGECERGGAEDDAQEEGCDTCRAEAENGAGGHRNRALPKQVRGLCCCALGSWVASPLVSPLRSSFC
jgi:hypothetical protein